MPLVESLQEARAGHRHSQTEAAARCGVARQTWQRWESGYGVPSVHVLTDLSLYLGMSVSDLLVLRRLTVARVAAARLSAGGGDTDGSGVSGG
jgi:transcriptional regulator with XRE-family HTH domain